MYEVIVIKEGYSISEGPGQQKACGTITLVKGPHNIIVDTGNPWDRDLILEGLASLDLTPADVDYVIGTSGNMDKLGNLNLFTRATYIVSGEVSHGDSYKCHGFGQGIPYEIDEFVEVTPTPGHTGSDVSVIVKKTSKGTVAITGDLFECLDDLDNPILWQRNSEHPELQQQNRIEILHLADFVIPGHGPMFQVPDEYKHQMKMVMFYEYKEVTDGPSASTVYEEYFEEF
ncbi:hypothetical protein ACJMK2_017746 [Sinanodonta woodiana]|uniref:Metallo-beta-lactamase domain-containing protein 1 n=1 Tax=Sinanodonta woodiana TaxID=1069815 RepID=A0ABD3UBA8_SINWO